MPYPVTPPMAPIAKPTPAPGGGGGGGGGGAPVPPGPDLQYQRMIREELIDLWDAIKKTHNAGNADVLAQFGALREEVIKKARGEVQHSVGNARKAVEALQYAQQGAQAATEQWQAGQEEATEQQQQTMLAGLEQLRRDLAADNQSSVGNQLAVLENAIVTRETPNDQVLQALRGLRDQIVLSTSENISENYAMFEALSRYTTRNIHQLGAFQRDLARGIQHGIDLTTLSIDGIGTCASCRRERLSIRWRRLATISRR